ncbi:hypothetical protein D1I28_23060 [Escherichia coli]|nr:hypothetical protein [Escherichia coli]
MSSQKDKSGVHLQFLCCHVRMIYVREEEELIQQGVKLMTINLIYYWGLMQESYHDGCAFY